MLRRFFVPAVLLLLAALVATPVLAQGQEQGQRQRAQGGQGGFGRGGFGGFGGFGGGSMFLLFAEKVQTEIELIDEQKTELEAAQAEMQEEMQGQFQGFGDLQNLSEEEREARVAEMREKMQAVTKKMQEKIESEILLPPQVERLKQINVQVRGVQALNDEEVATALGVTDDQKAEMQTIRDEMGQKFQELFPRPQGGQGGQPGQRPQLSDEEQQALREKMTALRTESDEKQLAVLTDEQKAQFEEMKGEPVSFDIAELQGGGGFGRGGFGGPGGRGGRRRGGDQPNQEQN